MELTYLDLKDLKMEHGENMDFAGQAGFGSQASACPGLAFPCTTAGFNTTFHAFDHTERTTPRPLPGSIDFESYSNPFTPGSSERSVSRPPSLSTDFDSSYGSVDSLSFDVTPPSSAVSTCFPIEMEKLSEMEGLPYTPTRYDAMVEATLGSGNCNSQFTPQNMDQYSFSDSLPSFFIPTPSHSIKSHASADISQTWVLGDSPVNFERRGSPLSSMASTIRPGTCDSVKRKLFTEGARQKTTVLRKIQGSGLPPSRPPAGIKRCSKTAPLLVEVSVAPSRKFKCDWPECQAKFKRTEHLKRHINSIHLKLYNVKCEFCNKTFNRGDNYESHLDLHANPDNKTKKTKRTDYFPAATHKLAGIKDARDRRTKKEIQRAKQAQVS
ncbi:hypothetical protein GQ53DRAFT_849908 [Thozetella sp. PMI_491]|nr:hypothetical protein GQ53DRAFT_849908 [Thozetella sp. PMI_491]